MSNKLLLIICGTLVMLTMFSAAMLVYRIVGLSRPDAFYIAGLTCSVLVYLVSRRLMRKREE